MARTIHGNLTGRAASIQRQDEWNERIEKIIEGQLFSKRYLETIQALKELKGEDYYQELLDNQPDEITKGDFLPIMEQEIQYEEDRREINIRNQPIY